MGNSGLKGVYATLSLIWGTRSGNVTPSSCPLVPPVGTDTPFVAPSCRFDEPRVITFDELPPPKHGDEKVTSTGRSLQTEPSYDFLQSNRSLGASLKHRYDFATFDSGARIVAAARNLKDVRAIQVCTLLQSGRNSKFPETFT